MAGVLSENERKVQLLDPHVINQIAAGEVVERPASVVKELVENAIDAGARRIEVEVREAGRRLIRVSDDGCGMSPEDARMALERHATSKIARLEDLSTGATLGFRGEAIPSIASVARMTIRTATVDGLRHVIEIEGGQIAAPRAEAGPRGTSVEVEDLFFNTPARLKFLKTDSTESSQIAELVGKYALAYPWVAFRLLHQGQVLLGTAGDGDLRAALAEVWGRDAARALVELDAYEGGARVRGFVSPPHATRPTRSHQWFFVNGRPVRSRTLTASLDQAYRSLTPERRYPMALILLELDPARVDANVSPTKTEVKFAQEGQAFDAVRHAVKSALLQQGMAPSAEQMLAVDRALREVHGAPPAWPQAPASQDASLKALFGGLRETPAEPMMATPSEAPDFSDPSRRAFETLLDGLRIIGQLDKTFILAENRTSLLIVDQHVAHERILYERIREMRSRAPIEKQGLLTPATVELDPRASALLVGQLDEVQDLGFDVEPFGAGTFLLRSAPAALRGKDPVRVLKDVIEELALGGASPAREAIWITCACKMAVKAGDPLSPAEMEKLITDLTYTENPYLCPHGRPITIEMPKDALMRRFKR